MISSKITTEFIKEIRHVTKESQDEEAKRREDMKTKSKRFGEVRPVQSGLWVAQWFETFTLAKLKVTSAAPDIWLSHASIVAAPTVYRMTEEIKKILCSVQSTRRNCDIHRDSQLHRLCSHDIFPRDGGASADI